MTITCTLTHPDVANRFMAIFWAHAVGAVHTGAAGRIIMYPRVTHTP